MKYQNSELQTKRKEYLEKFKDPRWQQLRLKVFERDEWACQKCFNNEATLVYQWALSDGNMQKELIKRYFEHLEEKKKADSVKDK